jgi:putative endonuclease
MTIRKKSKNSGKTRPNSSLSKSKNRLFYIYMIECAGGSFYTGYAVDIKSRWDNHCRGTASKYTRSFKPKKMAACWTVRSTKSQAMRIESAIKKLARNEKFKLIESDVQIENLLSGIFHEETRLKITAVECAEFKNAVRK